MSGRIKVVSASAGTGKTHYLTTLVADAIRNGDRPEGLVAITYTRKAASELDSRLRRRLLEDNQFDAAARFRDGYVGTVHAVAQRLLAEFPLEAGLSPNLSTIDDTVKDRLLARCVGEAIDSQEQQLDPLARRIGLDKWTYKVQDLVSKALSNAMGPADLDRSRIESLTSLEQLFEEPRPDPDYDAELLAAVTTAIHRVEEDDRRRSLKLIDLKKGFASGSRPPWGQQLAAVELLAGIRKFEEVALPLAAVVRRHLHHPAFHSDIVGVCDGVFGVAVRALTIYVEAKRRRGLLDYDDVLIEGRRLLSNPQVADELRERLDRVVVDEFQDTSPVQLALLVRLAELAKATTWVGDPKQAIYSFQGADPELTTRAMAQLTDAATLEVLSESRRSRPELVRFVSAVFAPAFMRHGMAREHVVLAAHRVDPHVMLDEACVEFWTFKGAKVFGDSKGVREAAGIAAGIADLLEEGVHVVADGVPRRAGPGDIAVMLRTNARCESLAAALKQRGIAVRVQQNRLLDTAEARLCMAGLALLADPQAGAPALDVAWLRGPADPDEWLDGVIGSETGDDSVLLKDPAVAAILALAPHVGAWTPSEALDQVLLAIGAADLAARWSNPALRVANLEALRAEARAFEQLCQTERRVCTLLGLILHLQRLADPDTERGDAKSLGGSQAAPTDPAAVTITTWHKAKGLEWPIVVLGSLGGQPLLTPFEVDVVPAPEFDATAPLAHRTIRWWPYPYGGRNTWDLQRRNTPFWQRAAATPEVQARAQRDATERARLLYVGFTRARDRLVLAVDTSDPVPADEWLAELESGTGERLVVLPDGPGPTAMVRVPEEEQPFFTRVRRLAAALPKAALDRRPAFRPAEVPPWTGIPDVVNPSSVVLAQPVDPAAFSAVSLRTIRDTIPHGIDAKTLGTALHGFLAADDPLAPLVQRHERARSIAAALAVPLDTSSWLEASSQLWAWVKREFGASAVVYREWPIRWRLPDQRLLLGEIDWLVDTGAGVAVVDHKSFPGGPTERDQRVVAYAGQLAAYAGAASSAFGKPDVGVYLHFPLRGEIQRVATDSSAFFRWLGTEEAAVPPSDIPQLTLPFFRR